MTKEELNNHKIELWKKVYCVKAKSGNQPNNCRQCADESVVGFDNLIKWLGVLCDD